MNVGYTNTYLSLGIEPGTGGRLVLLKQRALMHSFTPKYECRVLLCIYVSIIRPIPLKTYQLARRSVPT